MSGELDDELDEPDSKPGGGAVAGADSQLAPSDP
jgi:hypothetical protein